MLKKNLKYLIGIILCFTLLIFYLNLKELKYKNKLIESKLEKAEIALTKEKKLSYELKKEKKKLKENQDNFSIETFLNNSFDIKTNPYSANIIKYRISDWERSRLSDEFSWINKEQWNEIVLESVNTNCYYNYEDATPSKTITIDDKKIIDMFTRSFYILEEEPDPIHGFWYADGRYKCTLKSKEKSFIFYLEDNDTISITSESNDMNENNRIFRCFYSPNANLLVNGFFNELEYKKAGNIFTKIAQSSFVTGNIHSGAFQTNHERIEEAASGISKGKLLKSAPNIDINKENNYLVSYYHGEKIIINCHGKFLHIVNGNENYWLEYESEDSDEEYDTLLMLVLTLWTAG